MSYISPGTLIEEDDPLKLNARLNEAQAEQLSIPDWKPDAARSDEENAKSRQAYDDKLRGLIHEQMGIIFKLRKTATGPAAKGGKRAKKAPVDMVSLEESIFGAT